MELPIGKVNITRRNPKTLILYGAPKIGKTTLLAELEDTLLIDLEQGSDYVSAMKVKVHNLDELRDLGKSIIAAKRPYKRVAVDTMTKLEEWAEDFATSEYMKSPIGKSFNKDASGNIIDNKSVLTLPNGAGYLHLRMAFKEWVEKFHKLSEEVILIGHLKDKMIEKGGKEVNAKDLDLTGKLKSIVCSNADAIGYIFRQNGKMMITFESSDEVTCGSRCEHLKGKTMEFDWKKIYID
jgi:hypothetical protein